MAAVLAVLALRVGPACADADDVHERAPAAPITLGACTEGAAGNCDTDAAAVERTTYAESGERILDFHSRIVVGYDGDLSVTETIAVLAAGNQIKRGIYRDFPTTYTDDLRVGDVAVPLLRREVPFNVISVQRDGHDEPYHTERQSNGVRVYIGDADVTVPPGRHTYTLRYTTGRQLGFFDDHDELYWNVTGNGWSFPIDHAAATVLLPATVAPGGVTLEGYTGPQGSTGHDLTTTVDPGSGALRFSTTMPLDSHEGLTIVASFPKGIAAAPSAAEQRATLLRDNPVLWIAPAGLLLIALYYVGAWVLVGRDPTRGTIIPLFEPPLGLDAAGLRYVSGMGYDERCLTAAIVGLAVKGWARIADADGTFTISPSAERHTPIGAAERRVNSALLNGNSIELEQKNHSKIRSAIRSLRQALQSEYDGKMFRANRNWLVPGLVLSVLVMLVAGLSGSIQGSFAFAFMMVWLSVWTFACVHLVTRMWTAWRSFLRPGAGAFDRIGSGFLAILSTAFAVPFLGGEVLGLFMLTQFTSGLMPLLLLAIAGLNVLFYYLLKQPTLAGRKVMDQIEGFKMYLTTAEGAELAQAAPAKTPQLYERLLPYAIALEVENEWSEQFSAVLREAAQSGDGQAYQPRWYSGTSFDRFGSNGFATSFSSSLGSSIASSSVAPGSSSGSGGGGSSGGGGGGGGGGGW